MDRRADVLAERDGVRAVVPRKLDESELYRRITTVDEAERMPPPDSVKSLTDQEIELIAAWIHQGADWRDHWSFVAPVRSPLPAVDQSDWTRGPIDRFVLARLEKQGLGPSPEAARHTLIRRVTLDLTGLPPTLEEVDAFLADDLPDAYESLVDRLLASHRYGERIANDWLDAARYADTHGYHEDKPRDMWPWRDWVIKAFNSNMAFDQFTIEQLAGDLLPDATQDQKTATGFNRNHGVTGSGISEEYRVAYVIDRVNTTATTWMGLTIGCAQCHDHKYDPISQKEFYRFFAFFNNIPDKGVEDKSGNVVPLLKLRPEDHVEKRAAYRNQIAAIEQQLASRGAQVGPELASWEEDMRAKLTQPSPLPDGMVAHYPLDDKGAADEAADKAVRNAVDADSPGVIVGGGTWTSGQINGSLELDGATHVDVGDTAAWERTDEFSYGAWIYPSGSGAVVARMEDGDAFRGYDVYVKDSRVEVHIVHEWPNNALRVITPSVVVPQQWQHLFVTYDGSSKAEGIGVYLDGIRQSVEITHDSLSGTIRTEKPLHIGRRNPGGFFHGRIDDVRLYPRQLSDDEVAALVGLIPIADLLAIGPDQRSEEQAAAILQHYLENHDPDYLRFRRQIVDLHRQDAALDENLPDVMVMLEMEQRRDTFILRRGQYDSHGEKVEPSTPAVLPPLAPDAEPNRLGMARWLVDPAHPLTSRVAVNRLWQLAFGTGLVKTSENFGLQGERPSHPELLDWLAVEFIENGYDVKRMLKQIVTSATYRQSSEVSAELLARDPENRLLARGSRFRMPAEMIGDAALAMSGLLVEEIGGPSVKPYQPPGLWKEMAIQTYEQDKGKKLYRRRMYTYRKRQVPPPSLVAFDAPNREYCLVRRSRTNTPLQALVLMNDPTFVEAARALAERTMIEAPPNETDRLAYMFRLATARRPSAEESNVLLEVFRAQRAVFRDDEAAAAELLSVGETQRDERLQVAEHAAWTFLASLILNLDETMTKE